MDIKKRKVKIDISKEKKRRKKTRYRHYYIVNRKSSTLSAILHVCENKSKTIIIL